MTDHSAPTRGDIAYAERHYPPELWKREAIMDLATLIAEVRSATLEEAAKTCDQRAKWHEESFRKELILKNDDRQTHFAARYREAEELAGAIRNLGRQA